MPWSIRKREQQFCIFKEGTANPVPGGCHDTRQEAEAHLAALYASEKAWKAIDPAHPGAFLCLMLPPEAQQALAAAAPPELNANPDHLTLIDLGSDASQLTQYKDLLVFVLADLASRLAPVEGFINGGGRFRTVNSDGESAVYATFDSPELPGWYAALCMAVETIVPVEREHGFVPHITLGYLPPEAAPYLDLPQLPITFDSLSLIWAGQRLDLPLMGRVEEDDQAHVRAPETMEDAVASVPPSPEAVERARNQFATALGVDTVAMPDYKAGRRHSARDLRTMQAIHDLSVEQGAACAPPGKALDPEQTLVVYGGEIKALGDGRVGGYLVQYGSPEQTDLTGVDFFTSSSEFGPHTSSLVYYHHGMDNTIQRRVIDPAAKLVKDDVGVWVEAQLNMRDAYEREMYRMAERKKLGWSSGTAGHLVERVPVHGAMWIKTWPLGLDASLTPTPAEPRTQAIPLKSITAPTFVLPEAAVQAGGDPARPASAAVEVPVVHIASQRNTRMDEELKAFLESLVAPITTQLTAVGQRLTAIEEAPAIKTTGFVTTPVPSSATREHSFDDFLKCIVTGDRRRLATEYKSGWTDLSGDAIKDLAEGSGPSGGYLVPTEFEPELSRLMGQGAIFTDGRVRLYPMTAASKQIAALRQTDNPAGDGSDSLYGGISFTWEPENSEITESEPVFDMIELRARKAALVTVSSNELAEDAPGITSDVQGLFNEAMPANLDFFYLRGSGVGKPLGILNSAACLSIARTAAGLIDIADIAKMKGRHITLAGGQPIWITNPRVMEQLIPLKIGDTPIFVQNAAGPVAGTLLGYPLAEARFAPALGVKGDIGLYDLKAYAVGRRRGITIAMSEHANFTKDQLTWRVTYRGDGQPRLKGTIKLNDGANTEVSPFVALSTPA